MKAVGFIFARGGSKGLPKKNLQKIGGVSLVGRAVCHALGSGFLEKVVISSDDDEIIEEAVRHGAVCLFKRPDELASDSANEWDAWRHAVEYVMSNGDDFDLFVSVPVTSPLRISEDIDNAVKVYMSQSADVVITGSDAERNPYFNMVQEKAGGKVSLVCENSGIIRRQDAPPVYDMTTVAYVMSPDYIMNHDSIWSGNTFISKVPKDRCADIDNLIDLECARAVYALKPDYYDTNFVK